MKRLMYCMLSKLVNNKGGLPLGKYPSLVTRSNGEKTLVVQTNGYGRYLGDLTVDFDESGKVVRSYLFQIL